MPTHVQIQELYDNCTRQWTTVNDVVGLLFTASNGNSVFFPTAGSRSYGSLRYAGVFGYYWSSSLYLNNSAYALNLNFSDVEVNPYANSYRYGGFPIRPVRAN